MSSLHCVRCDRPPGAIRLLDGSRFDGRIKNVDRFAVIVEHEGADRLVVNHAIATVTSRRTMSTYYVAHDS